MSDAAWRINVLEGGNVFPDSRPIPGQKNVLEGDQHWGRGMFWNQDQRNVLAAGIVFPESRPIPGQNILEAGFFWKLVRGMPRGSSIRAAIICIRDAVTTNL